jgi:uncharacterized membrane protein
VIVGPIICMIVRVGLVGASIGTWAEAVGRWMEKHWLIVLPVSFAGIASLAALAPLLDVWGLERPASIVYRGYGLLCHQKPERSFWLAGQQMALCARDIGLLGGLALGGAIAALWTRIRLPVWWAILCVLPLAIDGGTQLLGLRESTNMVRVTTGLLAGLATALYLLPEVAARSARD